DLVQVQPALGRLYLPQDSDRGDARIAVLSHGFWQSAFGGDPAAIGRAIQLNNQTYEIIGVLPASMTYPRSGQIFIPYLIQERDRQPNARGRWAITAIGRLRADIPMGSLTARLSDVSARWHERFGGYDPASGHTLVGQPFVRWMAGELRGFLLVLQAAVVFLLLIACANVGNLQLVRATERERELAVRSALGAGSWSILRQLLLESGLLALAGGVAGVALATAAVALLRRVDVPELQALTGLRVDGGVLAYSALITLAATFLFGLLPAWRIRRPDLHGLLRQAGRGLTGGRLRLLRAGAVVQVALSVVLVLGAAALVRSLGRLLAIDPGFAVEHVTTFRLSLPSSSYPDAPRLIAAFDDITTRLRAMPGVSQVGYISEIPFGPGRNSSPFRVRGRPEAPGGSLMHADMRFVHDQYFEAMGIPLRRGRLFASSDNAETRAAALIDQRLADEFFPGEDPIGQVINQGPDAVIVGVVGSVKHGALQEDDKATVYYSYRQMTWLTGLTGVIRTSGIPITLGQLQSVVSGFDPDLPVFDVRTMQDRLNGSLGPRRVGTTVLAGFGLAALLLALLGVYGVLSYSISRRTQELGIRLALGALPGALVRSVTGTGLALGGIGLVVGIAGFAAANRLLGSLVYGVRVIDPVTIAAGIGILGVGVLLASVIPARRVVRVDPTQALREE
ncbi:MAG TPA: ADOP family duplicated permease, partial [Gemmatimonadales bacterium]